MVLHRSYNFGNVTTSEFLQHHVKQHRPITVIQFILSLFSIHTVFAVLNPTSQTSHLLQAHIALVPLHCITLNLDIDRILASSSNFEVLIKTVSDGQYLRRSEINIEDILNGRFVDCNLRNY